MGEVEFLSFPQAEALAAAAAASWVEFVTQARPDGRKFLIAISGGRIMSAILAAAVERAGERPGAFGPVEFFWADERCVAPTNPESNFRMADERFFQPLAIAPTTVHRIHGEDDPAVAAETATAELRGASGRPALPMLVLDLILLSMGEDGHVASLFPGDERAAADMVSVYRSVNNSPKPPSCRVTLGYGPIIAARQVWVFASGAGKVEALRKSLSHSGATPLGRLIRGRNLTRVYSDLEPG
jgi:6-phosphogluconolactonase